MSEEHRALPVPKPLDGAPIGSDPGTPPAPAAENVPIGDDGLAAHAVLRDSSTQGIRRRSRPALRIPDDEVARPASGVAPGAGVLTPTRIISIEAEPTPREAGDGLAGAAQARAPQDSASDLIGPIFDEGPVTPRTGPPSAIERAEAAEPDDPPTPRIASVPPVTTPPIAASIDGRADPLRGRALGGRSPIGRASTGASQAAGEYAAHARSRGRATIAGAAEPKTGGCGAGPSQQAAARHRPAARRQFRAYVDRRLQPAPKGPPVVGRFVQRRLPANDRENER